ncbi:MAG: hypothetical protein HYV27_23775 [Candidatus Hydrogenedentes bacterium]|nr:hypothetical protein [Candidatus Hydrogenedentota bacterium]
MIEFHCQHCGTRLRLEDEFAGRDGWCRVCKRMVIVPTGGRPARVEDLPPAEGYIRLQQLLAYAATKADKYKLYIAQEKQERNRLIAKEQELEAVQAELQAVRVRVAELSARCEEAAAGNEQRMQSLEGYERLQIAHDALLSQCRNLEGQLEQRDAEAAALRDANAELQLQLDRARSRESELSVALARLDASTVAKLDEAHAALDVLKHEMRAEAERVGELTILLAHQTEETQRLAPRAAALEAGLGMRTQELEAEHAQRERLEQELVSIGELLDAESQKRIAHQAEIVKLRQDSESARELAENLRTTLAHFQLEAAKDASKKESAGSPGESRLREQYELLIREHETQLNRYESLEGESRELHQRIVELQSQLAASEEKRAAAEHGDGELEPDDAVEVEVSRIDKGAAVAPDTAEHPPGKTVPSDETGFPAYLLQRQKSDRDEVMAAFLRFLDQ